MAEIFGKLFGPSPFAPPATDTTEVVVTSPTVTPNPDESASALGRRFFGAVVDNITTAAQGAGQTVAVTVQSVGQAVSDSAGAVGATITDTASEKGIQYLKSFSLASVKIVEEVDEALLTMGSAYEVANFNVSGNLSVMGGVQLVINFSKTKAARDAHSRVASTASGACPSCGAGWTVEKAKLAGRPVAGLRCQSCQTVFQVETKGFTVVVAQGAPPT